MKKLMCMFIAAMLIAFSTLSVGAANQVQISKIQDKEDFLTVSYAYADTAAEQKIVDGIKNYSSSISLSEFNIPKDQMNELIVGLSNNYGELFYFDVGSSSYSSNVSTKTVVSFSPGYKYTKEEVPALINEFNTNAKLVLDVTKGLSNDTDKALAVSSKLCEICTYDLYAENAHNAYGCLVDKHAVCQGYAIAYEYLMKQIGIDCEYVRGTSQDQGHAWNILKIDGKYYHVDVTWSDPYGNSLSNVSYDYYLLSDAEISNDHVIDVADHTCPDSYTGDNYWQDIASSIETISTSDKMYYFKNDGLLYSRSSSTGAVSPITSSASMWYVWGSTGSYWQGCYASAAMYKGVLLYNTPTQIYAVDTMTNKSTLVYTIPSSENGYLYGLDYYNGVLTAEVRQAPGTDTTAHTITLDLTDKLPKTIMLGDVNGDKVINVADIVFIQRYVAKCATFTADQITAADVTADGKVNISDVVKLQKYISKMIHVL